MVYSALIKRVVVLLVSASVVVVLGLGVLAIKVRDEVRQKFDGKRWSLPAIVYARSLEIYPGLHLLPDSLEEELQLAGYRKLTKEKGAGSYARNGANISLITRNFYYPTGLEPSKHLVVEFSGNTIQRVTDGSNGKPIAIARLDPPQIGSFHPLIHEDRLLISREEIPHLLLETLLVIEDQNFFSHHGVSPFAIARALFVNLRAGKTVQGGSTLTQQLVKNLFLGHERTMWRKLQEAIMALVLEYYYSKDEILTAYVNEVFLGQDDNRAVHGFALASQFYFRSDLEDLRPDQMAILVGMVKGPSAFDPRRNPENCRTRRNVVLERMFAHGIITEKEYREASAKEVAEIGVQKNGFNRFPAFLDLVKQQLAGEYKEEDLKTNGLRILTTLNPSVQYAVEKNMQATLVTLEKKFKQQAVEGAAVISERENGEVIAVAGGRNALVAGFNRALQAKRPIGSLVKPIVYLSALQKGYNLASPLEDTALTLEEGGSGEWSPANYDHKEHGRIPLFVALAHSYNLATVRLGMEIGLTDVISAAHALGYRQEVAPYPSMLLGSIAMTPYEVCQLYQTIAAGGFYTPLRAIDSVMAVDHKVVQRYGLSVEQRVAPDVIFLLTHGMQRVVSEGTASSLLSSPLKKMAIAGKTGTSDDLRDSWFAGFTGDHLAIVWLGHDDNTPIGMSGAAGALQVWQKIMEAIPSSPLEPVAPENVVWRTVSTTELPFLRDSSMVEESPSVPLETSEHKKKPGFLQKIRNFFQ